MSPMNSTEFDEEMLRLLADFNSRLAASAEKRQLTEAEHAAKLNERRRARNRRKAARRARA